MFYFKPTLYTGNSSPRILLTAILIAAIVISLVSGCSKDEEEEQDSITNPGGITGWPTDMTSILTTAFPDSVNDLVAMPVEQEGPPYSGPVSYPQVDVTSISLGIDSIYLYMRVNFAGTIPTAPVQITASGEVESQIVKNQGMNISLNTDNDIQTGSGGAGIAGVDIFFAVGFEYGVRNLVYANYDFPESDIHNNNQHLEGVVGEGGPGHKYAIVRYDISGLGSFLPLGTTVQIGSWSEAESYNADGSLKYHHFAFDAFVATTWTIPAG